MQASLPVIWLACAYLIGSIPFAVVVSKMFGLQDPRSYGSGNPGATNVLRSGNKGAAALTLIGDAAKGWFAVWLSQKLLGTGAVVALTAVMVFLGHLYPIFLKFKGGKGVATAVGVILALQPMLALICLFLWVLTAVIFKMSSLAALVSAVCAPVVFYLGGQFGAWNAQPGATMALVFISLMLIYRHSANISRILNGTESKIGSKK
ncbi:glycerol-3-phosphate 1-O-acyltransferase PlsY [Orrella sp. NBD-18]|uniref:Glycerol-3-phosphate acyltransferase n=1 Tax=Sheuella amnicola TaxID=2707330 RepID=A0A6B2QV27_9BURK|nr:glycerol-3-phosphate 1-O-acyltransferase PlsY [Sheuella amnicola]NDY82001.1 glycerol-3-phosphate 1-O-acyltransferase PlsY [Sheuella amnicola]HBI82994.1 glycerol-3-phosphate acyltransferase [Alcaligenaceae bacterium]